MSITKNKFMNETDDDRLMITENTLRDMCDVKEFADMRTDLEDLYIFIAELRK